MFRLFNTRCCHVSFLPYGDQRFFCRLRQEASVSAVDARSGEAMKTSPKSLWHPVLSLVICSVTCEVMVFSLLIYRTWNRGLCEWIISWKKDRNQALRLGKEFFNFTVVSDQWLFLLVFISLPVSFFFLFFSVPSCQDFCGPGSKTLF